MITRSECPLCECPGQSVVQVGVRNAPESKVRRCRDCGLLSLHPRPTEDELENYYTGYYREDYSAPPVHERFRADIQEARARVRRLLPLLHADTRLLEVGCGSGAFLESARPYVGAAIGVEPDTESQRWIEGQFGLRVVSQVGGIESNGSGICARKSASHFQGNYI